jgi:AraC-like DNA-binding protein
MDTVSSDTDRLATAGEPPFALDLYAFVSACQVLSDPTRVHERSLAEIAESLCAALPPCHTAAEFLLVRSIVVEFAIRAIEASNRCPFPALLPLLRLTPSGQALGAALVESLSAFGDSAAGSARSLQELRAARAMSVIATRSGEPDLDAAAVAHETNVSERVLGKLLHAQARGGFRAVLRQARVATAQALLTKSLYSVKEIAGHAGYAWTSQMDRDFQRECGVTPGEYRLRHAEPPRLHV